MDGDARAFLPGTTANIDDGVLWGHAALMLRLVWSVVIAGLVGGAVAAIAVKLLGIVTLSALAAYPLAVLVGVIVGLLAGKPVWVPGARVEAGLKAAFGALVAAGLMYALRAWVGFELDLSSAGLGQGAAGLLPVIAFPAVALVLSLLFEVDNMFGTGQDAGSDKKRIATANSKKRVAAGDVVEAELESDDRDSARRKR